MRATGREIVEAALELVMGPGADHDIENSEALAQHSKFVLDSLNAEPSTAIGGVERVVVPLPAGSNSFTWGPGGTIDRSELPSGIVAWNSIEPSGQEYPRGARLLSSTEFADLQWDKDADSDWPTYLYWPRTLNDSGQYEFFYWPRTSAPGTSIALYASVPKLDNIELDGEYQLDTGRGDFLVTQLALAASPVFGFPVSPQLRGRAREAAIRLGAFSREEETLQPPSRRYLLGGKWNRRGHLGGPWY